MLAKEYLGNLKNPSFYSGDTHTHLNATSTEIPISQLYISEYAQQRVHSDETSVNFFFHWECAY